MQGCFFCYFPPPPKGSSHSEATRLVNLLPRDFCFGFGFSLCLYRWVWGEPQLAVLRAATWVCAQGADTVPGIQLGLAECKASALPAVLSLGPYALQETSEGVPHSPGQTSHQPSFS